MWQSQGDNLNHEPSDGVKCETDCCPQGSIYSGWSGPNRGRKGRPDWQHQQATHSTGCQNQSRYQEGVEDCSIEVFSDRSRMNDSWTSFPSPDIEVACYGYDGIDAVKDALRAGLGCSTEVMPIKVILPSATLLLCYLIVSFWLECWF